jgi:hypothetical protein
VALVLVVVVVAVRAFTVPRLLEVFGPPGAVADINYLDADAQPIASMP